MSRCEHCGRHDDETGAPGCSCYEDALDARAEAVRKGRCLPCAGFTGDATGLLCTRHEQERAAERTDMARALRRYRAEGHAEAVRSLRSRLIRLSRDNRRALLPDHVAQNDAAWGGEGS